MKRKGFTLIELLIASVLLMVLAAIAIPNFLSSVIRAQEAEVKSVAHALQLAVEDYKALPGHVGIKPRSYDIEAFVVPCLLPHNVYNKVNPFNRPMTYGAGEQIVGGIPGTAGQVGYADNGTNPYSIIAMGKNQYILTLIEGQ